MDELKQALTELEALVETEFKTTSRRLPKTGPGEPLLCADCSRRLPSTPSPARCSGCGRGLCVDCALSSQFEDVDLRCIDCRTREREPDTVPRQSPYTMDPGRTSLTMGEDRKGSAL